MGVSITYSKIFLNHIIPYSPYNFSQEKRMLTKKKQEKRIKFQFMSKRYVIEKKNFIKTI